MATVPAEAPAREPVRWYEWPVVVVLMPFMAVGRGLRRLGAALAGAFAAVGRALAWAWNAVVLRPARAVGRALAAAWRALVAAAVATGRPSPASSGRRRA